MTRPSAESLFWLFALIYAAVVMLILIKTAPGFGHHGLAAMPALTVTLPTSVVLMMFAPESMGLGALIAITVVGASVNIGFVYAILLGSRGERATADRPAACRSLNDFRQRNRDVDRSRKKRRRNGRTAANNTQEECGGAEELRKA